MTTVSDDSQLNQNEDDTLVTQDQPDQTSISDPHSPIPDEQEQEAEQRQEGDANDIVVTKDGDTHSATHKKRKYIIEYQRDVCIGAASCAAIAPLTFQMDDENKAYIVEEGEWDEEEIILAAAQSCPVFAIIIKDAETGEQIFPIP